MKSLFPICLLMISVTANAAKFSFDEFKKISSIYTLIPLNSGDRSLVLGTQPGDPYSKIYLLNHTTRELTMKFDAGRDVGSLFTDKARANFYVLIDNNGDENFRIHSFDAEKGKTTEIFGHDGFKALPISFSKDGKQLFLRSNHENKAVNSIYLFDLNTKKSERLTNGNTSFNGGIVSFDDQFVALSQAIGNNEIHVSLLDVKTKMLRPLFAEKGTVYDPAFFSPDNKFLYVNTDANRDRTFCARIPLQGEAKLESVLSDPGKDLYCNYDDRYDLTFIDESFDGKTGLRVHRGLFGEKIDTLLPSTANIANFTVVLGKSAAIAKLSSADSPGDFVSFDLTKGANGPLKKITKLNRSKISDKEFAKSYDLKYKSFDGLDLHGIVFAKEEWVKKGEKHPAILWPHGGPDDHETHRYSGLYQFWNMNGFAVFTPNFRGSTGYGKKFETLNDRDWGGAHIKDLVWGKRELAKLPYIDADNIFIVGASFGGFSTLSTITQFPEEFKGAVAIVALANLFTFMKSIPPDPSWQNEFLTEVGDPVKDKAFYEERSPYFHADKIKTPLKIYQADNDVRTVKAEMDQYVAKLRELKIPVEYEILEKDGHSIARTENQKKAFEGSIQFLSKLVVGKSTASKK
jgi:dipeptidyl aminopeptidase/acylaminoacyl peptidase